MDADEDEEEEVKNEDDCDGPTSKKTVKVEKEEVVESKLESALQELIKMICDIKAMELEASELEFDTKRNPLGKVSAAQIKAGKCPIFFHVKPTPIYFFVIQQVFILQNQNSDPWKTGVSGKTSAQDHSTMGNFARFWSKKLPKIQRNQCQNCTTTQVFKKFLKSKLREALSKQSYVKFVMPIVKRLDFPH